MKITRDDLLAALRLRYDHYSAQTMFDGARERAALADQPAYDRAEVVAFRTALSAIGDRLDKVAARIELLLAEPAPSEAPHAAPSPRAEPSTAPRPTPPQEARDRAERAPVGRVDDRVPSAPVAADAPAPVETIIALTGVEVEDGEQIMVCGGFAELGDWDPARARPMSRSGDQWLATVTLSPEAEVMFKFLRRTADGGVVWEGGENRNLVARPRVDAVWR